MTMTAQTIINAENRPVSCIRKAVHPLSMVYNYKTPSRAFCSLNRPVPGRSPACESGRVPNILFLAPWFQQNYGKG